MLIPSRFHLNRCFPVNFRSFQCTLSTFCVYLCFSAFHLCFVCVFSVFSLCFSVFSLCVFLRFQCFPVFFTDLVSRTFYQISTLSASILNILLPSLTSNASRNSFILLRGWLHRNSFGPWGSSVTSWSARSFFTVRKQGERNVRRKRGIREG